MRTRTSAAGLEGVFGGESSVVCVFAAADADLQADVDGFFDVGNCFLVLSALEVGTGDDDVVTADEKREAVVSSAHVAHEFGVALLDLDEAIEGVEFVRIVARRVYHVEVSDLDIVRCTMAVVDGAPLEALAAVFVLRAAGD